MKGTSMLCNKFIVGKANSLKNQKISITYWSKKRSTSNNKNQMNLKQKKLKFFSNFLCLMIKSQEPNAKKVFPKIKLIFRWMFQEFLPKIMQKKLMDPLKRII